MEVNICIINFVIIIKCSKLILDFITQVISFFTLSVCQSSYDNQNYHLAAPIELSYGFSDLAPDKSWYQGLVGRNGVDSEEREGQAVVEVELANKWEDLVHKWKRQV